MHVSFFSHHSHITECIKFGGLFVSFPLLCSSLCFEAYSLPLRKMEEGINGSGCVETFLSE